MPDYYEDAHGDLIADAFSDLPFLTGGSGLCGALGRRYVRLHPELFFNISHSGEWIACVLGNVPVGIDIQYHREIKLEQTARKICTPDEWKTFIQAGTEKGKKDFLFQIWTKKESYLKYTGEGICRKLCEISYDGCRFYRLVMPEEYSGMVCVEN